MLFEESLALFRELGNKRVLAGVLHNLGNVTLSQGEAVQAATLFAESLALNDETGYQPGIADCFVGLAGVAGAQCHPERAVRLLGAAEPYLDAMRGFMPVADRTAYDRTVAAVQIQLDQATFAAAWAEGQAMPLEQAIAYALDEGERSARAS
jgi:non-specific serine/threonine protein kinase